jgi:hypothetical protein
MNFAPIPRDNLYKFAALTGAVGLFTMFLILPQTIGGSPLRKILPLSRLRVPGVVGISQLVQNLTPGRCPDEKGGSAYGREGAVG